MSIHKGDCRSVLKELEKKSVQTIYLDPPFNSNRTYSLEQGSNVGFEDKWTNESYTAFVREVVDVCLPLLKDDGSLFFHISSEQMFIPETVLREKFKYVRPIFWKRCRSKNNVKKNLGSAIDVIFWCSQSQKRKFNMVYQPRDTYYEEHSFKNKDARGNFALGHLVCDRTRSGYDYEFTIDGKTFHPERGWRISKEELEALGRDNRLYVPKTKTANLYKKIYLHETEGKPCMDLWDDIPSIAQGSEERQYPTAKPVKLLERIIQMTTDENDAVLDPMAGSGTTGVACRTLKRKYILIDQNDQAIEIMRTRVESS
jgi:site-specific DNA-methyltransferase (adenine-specific)